MSAIDAVSVVSDDSGKAQRGKELAAQAHKPGLTGLYRFYRYKWPDAHPGDFEFQLSLLRPGKPAFPLDHMVEQLQWIDEQSVLTGSVQVRRPVIDDPSTLPIHRGQQLRLRVRSGTGHWVELWVMRVGGAADDQTSPVQVTRETGEVQVSLIDDLALLRKGKGDWIYRKTAGRSFGYTATEITRLIARRVGVPVGQLAGSTHRFSLVKRKATAADALTEAWNQDKKASGRQFIIRLRQGRLEVVTIKRNPMIYVLSDEIETALIEQSAGDKQPVTMLRGTARVGKGSYSKKVSYTAFDRKVVAQFGAVRDEKDYGTLRSKKELRDRVNRDLADGLRLVNKITVQHRGIPFIRRGDGARIDLPAEGFGAGRAFVYCTRAEHHVQSGEYFSLWEFNFDDPFLKAQQDEAKAKAKLAKVKK